jgi:hypothetical protein
MRNLWGKLLFGCGIGFGLALFHFGGWHVAWGDWPGSIHRVFIKVGYSLENGFLIRINDGWYGVHHTARYFDAPIVQTIMFLTSIMIFKECFALALNGFCLDDDDNEEEEEEEEEKAKESDGE